MRLNKKTHLQELMLFSDDLSNFLTELHGKATKIRSLLFDFYYKNETTCETMLFDSAIINSDKTNGNIIKGTIPQNIKDVDENFVLSYLNLPAEYCLILQDTPDREPLKKQKYFGIICFYNKPKQLIAECLRPYLALASRYLWNKKRVSIQETILRKKDLLTAFIKRHIEVDIINILSNSKYEKRELRGSVIYTKEKDDTDYKVKFKKKIAFTQENMRLIRKVFEMSDETKSIIIHDGLITGLGTNKNAQKKITFSGHQRWTLNLNSRNIIRYAHGHYYFEQNTFTTLADLPRGFVLKKYEKEFDIIMRVLSRQKHGALLIISDNAKQEVERLSQLERGYAIDTLCLKDHNNIQLMSNLSSVDGAVFIDTDLNCYGAGIILDGIAKQVGSNARGSRYNSSRCYIDNQTQQFVAIVFSEDETVDILNNFEN